MFSTMTSADLESVQSAWDCKVVTLLQIAEQRRVQLLWQAQRITNSRDEAEDILREALLKAFTSLPQFRGES